MLKTADWPLIENLDFSGCPLSAEAAEVLITCSWSHLRHLRSSCTHQDDSVLSQMFHPTWSCLGYKRTDQVSDEVAHVVLSTSAVIHPLHHIYTDSESWYIRWCFQYE